MPLNFADFQSEMLKITDQSDPGFTVFPATAAEVAQRWAACTRSYFEGMAAPTLLPGAHALAEITMRAAMAVPTPASLVAGFSAYAATLALNATPGLIVVPPAVPLVLPALPSTDNPHPPALAIATTVDTWARTGTWTPGGPPPAPWS